MGIISSSQDLSCDDVSGMSYRVTCVSMSITLYDSDSFHFNRAYGRLDRLCPVA